MHRAAMPSTPIPPPPAYNPDRFRLLTLGRLLLVRPDGTTEPSLPAGSRRLALLAYLALGRRPFTREHVAEVFWGDRADARARHSLRMALSDVRRVLGEEAIPARAERVVLAPGAPLDVDVLELAAAAREGSHARVVALYGGAFLDGIHVPDSARFEEWRAQEAANAERLLLDSCAAECARAESRHDWQATIDAAELWLRQAPLEPAPALTLLRACAAPGTAEALGHALTAYERLAVRLTREFDKRPDAAVKALAGTLATRLAEEGAEAQRSPAPVGAPSGAKMPASPTTQGIPEGQTLEAPPPSEPWGPHGAAEARPAQHQGAHTRARASRVLIAVAGAVGILALAGGAWLFSRRSTPAAGAPRLVADRVVVVPFENLTGDSTLNPVGSMAADWITRGLGESGSIEVVPPDFVFAAGGDTAGGAARLERVARETRAATIVRGSYYRQAGRIFLEAEVLDGASLELRRSLDPVWAPADTLLPAIDVLRQRVAGAVAMLLDKDIGPVAQISPAHSLEAYHEWVVGRDLFLGALGFAEALPHLYRAAELDTTFVVPLIMAAAVEGNLGNYAAEDSLDQQLQRRRDRLLPWDRMLLDVHVASSPWEGLRAAKALYDRFPAGFSAQTLGSFALGANRPALAVEVLRRTPATGAWRLYFAFYTSALHMLGEHRGELAVAETARARLPERLSVLSYEIQALTALGRSDEVARLLDHSLALPPEAGWTPATVMEIAGEEYAAHGDTAGARAALLRALAWQRARPASESGTEAARADLAFLLLLTDHVAEAEPIYRALSAEVPTNLAYRGYLAVLAVRRGDRAGAERIAQELDTVSRPHLRGKNRYWQAVIAAQVGRREQAVSRLREAFAQGYYYGIELHRDPLLAPLRDYAPFQELLRPER